MSFILNSVSIGTLFFYIQLYTAVRYTSPMNFSEYQTQSRVTATYPRTGHNFIYPTLGLVGEAGEVAEKIKKLMRDKGVEDPTLVSEADRMEIKKELGDVLWYVAQLSTELGLDLSLIAEANIEKLRSRMERAVLHGDGDNR
jgi:NTP pyrophosphatase (non-canonical NTP hydrolase)